MPLYDFFCQNCREVSTLLLKPVDQPHCPTCASINMEKLLSPFAVGGRGESTSPGTAHGKGANKESAKPAGHVCSGGCAHGRTEGLVKKYLG